MASEETTLKTYRGNCHCGAFVFEMKAPEITSVVECNCSMCTKKAYLWVFPVGDLDIVKGEGTLAEYTSGAKKLKHKFCPTCGTPVMALKTNDSGGETPAVNARALQKVDPWKLERKFYHGADKEPLYEPPVYKGPEPSAEVEGGKIYTGSCHCGAVTLALKSKPLDATYPERITDCNCSVCRRGGYVWIYPMREQVVIEGEENLSRYSFGYHILNKTFCKTCGVLVSNETRDLTAEEFAALPEGVQQWHAMMSTQRPVTLRLLNNFDLEKVPRNYFDGWKEIVPPYQEP